MNGDGTARVGGKPAARTRNALVRFTMACAAKPLPWWRALTRLWRVETSRKRPAAAIQIPPPRAFVIFRFPWGARSARFSRNLNRAGLNLLLSGAAMSKFDLRFNGVVILCVGIATGLAAIFFFA